ncbi:MAG: beta-ketoacyl-ACP synthase II [Bacillota bacterium]|nr:beta-ketoacyl-ACP synthase II [Bacillota bacterium]
MSNRVVITGMGVISPIGNTLDEFWQNMKSGKCGISEISGFDTEGFSVTLAAEVKDFEPELYMEKKEARRMDRFAQFAIAASKQAVLDAKLDMNAEDPTRISVVIGSGIGGLATIEKEHTALITKGPRRVSPMMIPMIITNMAAGNVAIALGAKGMCTNVVTACATGTNAIGDAFRHIKNGLADVAVAGGSESSITPLGVAGFASLTALSTSTDPKRASIPFDKERNGFVMGEGAGIVILESLEHAKKRGAHIYAEVTGYGATCDAYHITSPSPDGSGGANAMLLAIEEAGISPKDISYINAHGTSTQVNDKFETVAVKSVFGEDAKRIPMSSTKSMTGHLLGAAGAVEAIACVKAIEDDFVPATIGLNVPDPECDLDYVPNAGREMHLEYTLTNSLGFGGHNASLIIKRYID